jgi:uncharacterized protein
MSSSLGKMPGFEKWRSQIETLAAALAGIALFLALGLPTPALSGAMIGVAIMIGFGRRADMSSYLRDFGMLISGMAMGAAVTPEMLQGFHRYPLSLLMLFAALSLGMFLSYQFLRLVGRWDRDSAFFACVPGALSVVLVMANESKANLAKVSIAQSSRLFILFAVLPSLVSQKGVASALQAKSILEPLHFALILAGGALLALLLKRVHFAAPWIFGGMIMSAVVHGGGLIVGASHPVITQIGFALVGTFIGTRFAGIARENFFKLLFVSVGSILIGLMVTVIFAFLAEYLLNGVTFGQAVIAFAPGAFEGMVILGAALALDPIYVGLHHLVRFIGIGFVLPLGYSVFKRSNKIKNKS